MLVQAVAAGACWHALAAEASAVWLHRHCSITHTCTLQHELCTQWLLLVCCSKLLQEEHAERHRQLLQRQPMCTQKPSLAGSAARGEVKPQREGKRQLQATERFPASEQLCCLLLQTTTRGSDIDHVFGFASRTNPTVCPVPNFPAECITLQRSLSGHAGSCCKGSPPP